MTTNQRRRACSATAQPLWRQRCGLLAQTAIHLALIRERVHYCHLMPDKVLFTLQSREDHADVTRRRIADVCVCRAADR